jgi:hypothetical protein
MGKLTTSACIRLKTANQCALCAIEKLTTPGTEKTSGAVTAVGSSTTAAMNAKGNIMDCTAHTAKKLMRDDTVLLGVKVKLRE